MAKRISLMAASLLLAISVCACARQKPAPPTVPQDNGTIIVELEGFRNSRGNVIVSLFGKSKGFPEDVDEALENADAAIAEQRARVVFRNIPYGEYALSVLHDENRNGRMDSNLMGIPKEGHGASNDPQRQFAPPKFEEARFLLDSEEKVLTVRLRYFKRKTPWNNS